MRGAIIYNYKKEVNARYRRHTREDWTSAQWESSIPRCGLGGLSTKPRILEGAVNLIIEDSLVRVLNRDRARWQIGILSLSGAAMSQMLVSLEMLGVGKNTQTR